MHGFDPIENVRVRVCVELTDGTGQRIANIDVSRELPGILGRHGFETAERLLIDFVELQVMSPTRSLVRAHIARHRQTFACEQRDRPIQPVRYDKEIFDEVTAMLLRGKSRLGD